MNLLKVTILTLMIGATAMPVMAWSPWHRTSDREKYRNCRTSPGGCLPEQRVTPTPKPTVTPTPTPKPTVTPKPVRK